MSTFTSASATVIKATASGLNGSGSVGIQGLKTGDVLLQMEPFGFVPGFSFEAVVTADDQLQQLQNLDWSAVEFTFYLLRGV